MAADSRIQCVAFDFDGTLVDSNSIKENGFYVVAERRAIERRVVDAAFAEKPRGNRFQISKAIAERLERSRTASRKLALALANDYTQHCLDAVASCPEVPGASEALAELGARVTLYLNSATPEIALKPILERRRIAHHFRGILGGPTPKIENLQSIANGERLTASSVLFVGDSDDDAAAAIGFGCEFIGITLNGSSRFRQPMPRTRNDLIGLAADILG